MNIRNITAVAVAFTAGLAVALAVATVAEAGCDPNNQCPPVTQQPPTAPPPPAPPVVVEPSPEEETPPPPVVNRDPHPQQCVTGQPFAPGQCATHPPTVITYTPCQLALQAFLQHKLTVADVLSICNRQPLPAPPRTDLPPNIQLPRAGS